MGGKRSYILKNQRIIYGHDNVSKMCFCIFLVLLVISVIIGLTAYFVKNAQSNSEEKHDRINYHDEGNNEVLQINEKVSQHPNIGNDYLTTVDGRTNVMETSKIAEFISTTVESPLSTSTISPRFVFVSSNTDDVETDSTNDYVRVTMKTGDEVTPFQEHSTETDSVNDSLFTPDEDHIFQLTTKSQNTESTLLKRSTKNEFLTDASSTLDDNHSVSRLTTTSENDESSLLKRSRKYGFATDPPSTEHNSLIDSRLTTKSENEESSLLISSTKNRFVGDGLSTSDDNHSRLITKSENDDSSLLKRSTKYGFVTDAPSMPDNLIDFGLTETYSTESESDDRTCKTDICKQSNSRMLALMNHNADPCEDFYSFACGGFDINHFKEFTVKDSVSQSLLDMSTLDLTVPYNKLYHDFFISCAKYKTGSGFTEVSMFIYKVCQSHNQNLTDLIADILMMHPQKTLTRLLPLFDVNMEIGPENKFVPNVGLPKLNSLLAENDEQDFYQQSCLYSVELETLNKRNKSTIQQSFEECLRNETEYFEKLKDSIKLFQIFEHLPSSEKQQKIEQTVDFIKSNIIDTFGSISHDELNNDNYHETLTLNALQTFYPQIGWRKLFEKLFGENVAKGITVVRLSHSKYLANIFEFYNTHSFADIKISLLSMMAHDMYIDFVEPISPKDRIEYCANLGMKLMPDIASKLYLDKFNSKEILVAENKLKKIFDQIVDTFKTSLNKNTWTNSKERHDALEKVSGLNLTFNAYTFFNCERNYRKLYAGLEISEHDYISNVFALKRVIRRRMYDTYGQSALSQDVIWNYLVWPISTTPYPIKETNSIVVPTSLIESLRYKSQKIEEFSKIGFSIAQEIARLIYTDETSSVFIDENVNFDKLNIFGIKLSDKDIQSSKHSRFIDDVALRVTFDAYKQVQSSLDLLLPWSMDHYSFLNMFYVLISQSFCHTKKTSAEVAISLIQNEELPNYFRVNSMMMNSEDFLNTFECR